MYFLLAPVVSESRTDENERRTKMYAGENGARDLRYNSHFTTLGALAHFPGKGGAAVETINLMINFLLSFICIHLSPFFCDFF